MTPVREQRLSAQPFGAPSGPISTTVNLPDTLTIGLRQGIGDRFTLLAGYEWSNWSRIGTALVSLSNGGTLRLPFNYQDGHFYSIGGEYKIDPAWTIRAGIGFEKSPISDVERTPRLPDNDRFWLSAGLTYRVTPKLSLDLAYSHLFVKDTSVALGPGTGNPSSSTISYSGSVDSHVDIVSLGIRYRFDDPVVPVKQVYHK